ncbi:monofunctional biosynthetic peptidoglycan transglycosylase [Marinobacter pelagius]|uniref:monofunctional biosynthetic peptidoglycan transglycosylase n=1 Tax=Marinobacter sp. C7 TaxID=2951363 RepID=UPI001EEFC807|nr:monofunctional biosynthetic peptidoglycan transglycosylase [Marinobacter sp. C7]MCG7198850.1 monofunctional biosynthetic peptidoglycan transglycosylase [Marinobacter sp. C7]
MARRRAESLGRKALRWLTWSFLGALAASILLLLLFRFVNPPTSAFMVGYWLGHPDQELRQEWVPYEQISPWMPLAVVASEDQRFPEHWGVDFNAIHSAVEEYIQGEGLRGASTISQQTAKNLFLWNGRSFVRKALEAGLAVTLEVLWPKERILEVYLNIAEFGPGIYGVEAASRVFFGIPANQLSRTESAMLAAVLPNPKVFRVDRPSAYVWDRVDWINRQMGQLGLGYLKGL